MTKLYSEDLFETVFSWLFLALIKYMHTQAVLSYQNDTKFIDRRHEMHNLSLFPFYHLFLYLSWQYFLIAIYSNSIFANPERKLHVRAMSKYFNNLALFSDFVKCRANLYSRHIYICACHILIAYWVRLNDP